MKHLPVIIHQTYLVLQAVKDVKKHCLAKFSNEEFTIFWYMHRNSILYVCQLSTYVYCIWIHSLFRGGRPRLCASLKKKASPLKPSQYMTIPCCSLLSFPLFQQHTKNKTPKTSNIKYTFLISFLYNHHSYHWVLSLYHHHDKLSHSYNEFSFWLAFYGCDISSFLHLK